MKKHFVILLAAALLLAFSFVAAAYGEDAEPGTAGDPIVTKSYVDKVITGTERMISDLRTTISGLDRRVTALEAAAGDEDTPGAAAPTGWEVIKIEKGDCLLGKEGTEIVLRSGTASAIDNGKDGISDLTGGADLKSGVNVEKNHLLLVPREDGRGIRCLSDNGCYVMVCGGYTVK